MKIIIKIALLIVGFLAVKMIFSRHDIRISNLPCKELSFQELPQDVQSAFSCIPPYQPECMLDNDFFEESTHHWLISWDITPWLVDATRSIVYMMDTKSFHVVVFEDKFYEYSNRKKDLTDTAFFSYELRTEKITFFNRFFVRLKDRLDM